MCIVKSITSLGEETVELKLKRTDLTNAELDEIEKDLAQELKTLCDENGKETNVQASAELLHQLGQVYQRRSPDMFSIIRSAALYNAALARNPPNKQTVLSDLEYLCSHILSLAGARNNAAQLITQANRIKQVISVMRQKVKQRLMEIKSIPLNANGEELRFLEADKLLFVEDLQYQLTKDYKSIMADLALFCEKVMGEPPCKFALTGMGSLARCEITPFSDFENIILLDNAVIRNDESYEKKLQYFRWFSVVFQIVLINLQETIVPSVAIDSLNNWFFDDVTVRGICFDGMMPHACKFPLGRQQPTKKKPFILELIQPVDEMLKYLSTEENLKNGYHLSDILTKTCFVYKDKDIFDVFENGVRQIITSRENQDRFMEDVKKQVIDDIQMFATRSCLSKLKPNQKFNMKRVVYRSTTLFISALGRIYNISSSSCFDILWELHAKNWISDYAKHKLQYAIALACEIRLRWYIKVKKQMDNINSVEELIELIGRRSTLSYFQIAYALQCDISKRLNLKRNHFYSSPNLLNLSLGHCFEDQKHMREMLKGLKRSTSRQRLHYFDECLKVLEMQSLSDSLSIEKINYLSTSFMKISYWKELQRVGEFLVDMHYFDDAVECFQKSTEIIERIELEKNEEHKNAIEVKNKLQKNISKNYRKIGYSLVFLNKHKEAKNNLEKSIELSQKLSPDAETQRDIAITLKDYGLCLSQLNDFSKAEQNLEKSLQILKDISSNIDLDYDVSEVMHEYGRCLMKTNFLGEAKAYLEKSLQIQEKITLDSDSDHDISATLHVLGCCLRKMNELDEAKSCFDRSLQIDERLSSDRDISITLHELGCCLMKMDKNEDAKSCFDRSLHIQKQRSLDVDFDSNVSVTLHELGCCFVKMDQFQEAEKCLEKSLRIQERLSLDDDADLCVSVALHELGCCLVKLGKLKKARNCLEKSLKIKERKAHEYNFDHVIAVSLLEVGKCLMKLHELEEAKDCFDRMTKILERIYLGIDFTRDVSATLRELGNFFKANGHLEAANACFEKSDVFDT